MMFQQTFVIDGTAIGKRLDIFLAVSLEVSRAKAQTMIQNGAVYVNGKQTKKIALNVRAGDVIAVSRIESADVPEVMIPAVLPEIAVLADTDDYLVIEKPSGLLVHETQKREATTLAAWILQKYPDIAGVGDDPARPGIVHRLDREASGLLVIAKTNRMFDALKRQFQERTIEKEYIVLVHGTVAKDAGAVDFPIGRGSGGIMAAQPKTDPMNLRSLAHARPGKESVTEYAVEKRFARFTLLRVRIRTGRTHQIRVHMRALNHPVVGDAIYMNKKLNTKKDALLGRLFLHATRLCFDDLTLQRMCFSSPLPAALQRFLDTLK